MRELILAFLHLSSSWAALTSVVAAEGAAAPLGLEFRGWQEASKRMLDSVLSALHSAPGKFLSAGPVPRVADGGEKLTGAVATGTEEWEGLRRVRLMVEELLRGEEEEEVSEGSEEGGSEGSEERPDPLSESIRSINFKILLRKKRNYRDFSRSQILSRGAEPGALSRQSVGFYGDMTYFNVIVDDNIKQKVLDIMEFVRDVDPNYLVQGGKDENLDKVKESILQPLSLIKYWIESDLYKTLIPILKDIQEAFSKARVENKADFTILIAANQIELMFINCVYRELDLF